MNEHNQSPETLYTLDMEKKCAAARASVADAVKVMRACGNRVSFYREFMITTSLAPHCVVIIDCLSPIEARAKIVPSIGAAAGYVHGRRMAREYDWRQVAKSN